MPDFSFINKLRLDNLYPISPSKAKKSYPLYNRFMQEMNSPNVLNEDRGFINQMTPQLQQTGLMNNTTPPMDVVFNDNNISETARGMNAARVIHDVNLNKNALTPYQSGQLSLRDREIQQRGALAQGKLGIDSKKAEIADYKARNPGHRLTQGKDGILRSFNPLTNQVTVLGETGMSEEEIAALDQTNDLIKIGAGGAQDRLTEGVRQKGRETLADMTARHAREKQDDAQQSTADIKRNTPILPSQERIAKLTRAEEARNTHPEWASYIKIVPGGGFVIKSPGRFTGPDQATYDAINKFIEGTPNPIRSVETSSTTTKKDPLGIRK